MFLKVQSLSERTHRSFLFFLTSTFKSVGLLCLTFFLTPVLLKLIGAADFGTFKVLMEVYGFFSLLEFGLYSSLIACLIPLLKERGHPDLMPLLSEGKRLYWRAAIVSFVVALGVMPFLRTLTNWSGPNPSEFYLTFVLMAGTSLLLPLYPYRIYLEASNQGHKVNLIVFLQNLLFLLLGISFAYAGLGLVSQGLGHFLASLISFLLLRHFADVRIPSGTSEDRKFLDRLGQFRRSQVLNDLATKIGMNCDQIIIALFLGPVMVTKVFLGQRVAVIIQGQLQSMGQASFASLGALYYSDAEAFKKRLMEVTTVLASVGAATLVPVCVLNRPFIALWVGEGYQMESNTLTYLASANAFLYGLFSFWAIIFTVLGKPAEITRMIWKQATVNVIVSVIFTKIFGGVGPIAGTLTSFLLVPLWNYPLLLQRHFGLPLRRLAHSILWPIVASVLPLTIYHYSEWKLFPSTWIGFIASGLLLVSIYLGFFFVVLFNPEERDIFLQRLRKLWQRLR